MCWASVIIGEEHPASSFFCVCMLKRCTFGLVRDPEMVMVEYGLQLLPIAGEAFLPYLTLLVEEGLFFLILVYCVEQVRCMLSK